MVFVGKRDSCQFNFHPGELIRRFFVTMLTRHVKALSLTRSLEKEQKVE